MCGKTRIFWNDANKFKIAGLKEVRAGEVHTMPAAIPCKMFWLSAW
jgi:hypothetical protein